MLTTATSSDPTPLSIGHAGTSVASLKGVPSVTGVGHCGSKACTRANLLAICRSIGGWTTADSCTEGTVTNLLVSTMQAHAIQHKQKVHRMQTEIKRLIYIKSPLVQSCNHIIVYYTTHRCLNVYAPTQQWYCSVFSA